MNEFMLTVNAIACGASAFRLMAYSRNGATHRPAITFFAWVLIVACASVTIRVLTGDYTQANWSETLINAGFCASVWASGGNVARLFKPLQKKHS